jgi:hypothetical protein
MDSPKPLSTASAEPQHKLSSQKLSTETSQQPFADVLKSQQAAPLEADKRAELLGNLYELHQRAQITGVPTSLYNAAVQALGLDPIADPFAGIHALKAAGFEAGSPSIGAILKYGAKPQAHGNQSYLAQEPSLAPSPATGLKQSTSAMESLQSQAQQDTEVDSKIEPMMEPNEPAIFAELSELNAQYDQLLDGATNYFEAATALAQRTDIQPYKTFTLSQALPLMQQALANQAAIKTAADWLQTK